MAINVQSVKFAHYFYFIISFIAEHLNISIIRIFKCSLKGLRDEEEGEFGLAAFQ